MKIYFNYNKLTSQSREYFFSNGNYQNILLTKTVLILSEYFTAKLVEGQKKIRCLQIKRFDNTWSKV
jgi:hypothetical protein